MHDLTDHLPNFIILKKFSGLTFNIKLCKRDYSSFSQSALIDDVRTVNWQSIVEYDTDPSRMFDSFYKNLIQIVDKHIPVRRVSKRELKSYSKPWITTVVKTSVQMKNALYRKYLETKSVYCNNYFLVNINDSKKVWNGIKEIVNFKAKKNQKTTKIVQNNTELTDPKVVANAFNNYFANVGANLARSIPDVSKSSLEYLKNPLCNNFYLFPVTPAEIETQISNLNSAKTTGPYSLPAKIIKIL